MMTTKMNNQPSISYEDTKWRPISVCSNPEELSKLNEFLKEHNEEPIEDMETLAETQIYLANGPYRKECTPAEVYIKRLKGLDSLWFLR